MEDTPGESFDAGNITTKKSCSAHIKMKTPRSLWWAPGPMSNQQYQFSQSQQYQITIPRKRYKNSDFISNTEYLPTFFWVRRDFVSEFPKTSQRLPRISDDFPKTYERFRKSPKMFRRTLNTSEAIWKATNLACFERITTQSQHYAPLWNIFVEIAGIEFPLLIMC